MELFFPPFLLSSYCLSVGLRVVSIVSGGCNQSFYTLFYVVFESLYRCVNTVSIIIIIIIFLPNFSLMCSLTVFKWSLSDNKSPLFSRTLFSILIGLLLSLLLLLLFTR